MSRILIISIVLIACYICTQTQAKATMQQIDSSSDNMDKFEKKIFSIKVKRDTCKGHGDPCVSDKDCCNGIKCHKYANRCQVQITEEELTSKGDNIFSRLG